VLLIGLALTKEGTEGRKLRPETDGVELVVGAEEVGGDAGLGDVAEGRVEGGADAVEVVGEAPGGAVVDGTPAESGTIGGTADGTGLLVVERVLEGGGGAFRRKGRRGPGG
jgi:hypothetical protein